MNISNKLGLGVVSMMLSGAACTGDGSLVEDPEDPPIERSAFEACVARDGRVEEQWSTSNFRGAVTALVVGDSTVVLASQDGSVKQWRIGGDPSYGTTFSDEDGPVVGALAISSDGFVLGVDRQGSLREWRLSDAKPMKTTPIAEIAFASVAVSAQADLVAVSSGVEGADIRIVERASGTVIGPLATELWGVTSVAFGRGELLVTAGHWYGVPLVERRAASSPDTVIEEWRDELFQGHVQAVAVDPSATRVVATGDGFVAVLDATALAAGPLALTRLPEHRATSVVILPGGELFATAGAEGTLKVWKLATAELVTTVNISAPVGIGTDKRGEQLFTSGGDGNLRAVACR